MTPRWGLELQGVGIFLQRCRLYEARFASRGTGLHSRKITHKFVAHPIRTKYLQSERGNRILRV